MLQLEDIIEVNSALFIVVTKEEFKKCRGRDIINNRTPVMCILNNSGFLAGKCYHAADFINYPIINNPLIEILFGVIDV